MPLNAKGERILAAFKQEYGGEEGERNFYASINAGTIKGVDSDEKTCDCQMTRAIDSARRVADLAKAFRA